MACGPVFTNPMLGIFFRGFMICEFCYLPSAYVYALCNEFCHYISEKREKHRNCSAQFYIRLLITRCQQKKRSTRGTRSTPQSWLAQPWPAWPCAWRWPPDWTGSLAQWRRGRWRPRRWGRWGRRPRPPRSGRWSHGWRSRRAGRRRCRWTRGKNTFDFGLND